MIILNAGVPRSGTVLVNAIIRELLRGLAPSIIQLNPHGAKLAEVLAQLEERGQHLYATALVHTHTWNRDIAERVQRLPRTKAVVNYRDPRDVCVSLMALHDIDFDTISGTVLRYFADMNDCATATGALVLPYELLTACPEAAIFQIARHLELWPRLDQVRAIAEATSVDKHRAVMEDVRAGKRPKLAERRNSKRVLLEDRETLINDRHIQRGTSGRWKTELTPEQQKTANERFAGLLARYGYEQGETGT